MHDLVREKTKELLRKKNIGAAEHGAALATHTGGAVHQLPETPNDVMSVRRLGPDMFQCTLRSATIWQSDAQLLMSLPHGEARLATLQTKERVAQAKAKTKAKAKAEEEPPR